MANVKNAAEDAAQSRALSDKDKASLQERRDVADKAASEAASKSAAAEKARVEADESKLSPEQKKVRDAEREADDARAKANQAARDAEGQDAESTVADANVLGYGKHPDLAAGHHLAQKFGNDPANPRPATNMPEVTDNGMVRLYRGTPDSKDLVYTSCHPDMVGDYMRAGWNRVEGEPGTTARTAADRETAPDGTTIVNDRTNESQAPADPDHRGDGKRQADDGRLVQTQPGQAQPASAPVRSSPVG